MRNDKRNIDYREALREALREEMLRDSTVFLLGEDIGRYWEGAFKVTKGLAAEFGDERVRDTPISESAIVGVAVGDDRDFHATNIYLRNFGTNPCPSFSLDQ